MSPDAAAMAQLAGADDGATANPGRWIETLASRGFISDLAGRLLASGPPQLGPGCPGGA